MGVYVDDTPVTGGAMRQISGAVFDLARVEVLKGPQGTLFGEGAMSGTLRYITNRPDPQARTARVKAEYSHMDESDDPTYIMSGVVNVPLDDRLSLRVSGQYRDRAGYMDTLETRNEKDVNWRQDLSIRARIESVVSDKLVVNGSISYYDGEYGGPSLAVPVPYDRPYETRLANKNFHDRFPNLVFDTHWSYNLAVNWDLGFADLLSSTSIFERDSELSQEVPSIFIRGRERAINRELRTPANPNYDPTIPDGMILEALGRGTVDSMAANRAGISLDFKHHRPLAMDGGFVLQRRRLPAGRHLGHCGVPGIRAVAVRCRFGIPPPRPDRPCPRTRSLWRSYLCV